MARGGKSPRRAQHAPGAAASPKCQKGKEATRRGSSTSRREHNLKVVDKGGVMPA